MQNDKVKYDSNDSYGKKIQRNKENAEKSENSYLFSILHFLNISLNSKIEQSSTGTFDYVIENESTIVLIELKQRHFHKEKYQTTIIGKNKVDYFHNIFCNSDKQVYAFAFFLFTDGLYCYRIDNTTLLLPSKCFYSNLRKKGESHKCIEIHITELVSVPILLN